MEFTGITASTKCIRCGKEIATLWYKMDITTRLGIACIGLYLSLYIMLDLMEIIFDITI